MRCRHRRKPHGHSLQSWTAVRRDSPARLQLRSARGAQTDLIAPQINPDAPRRVDAVAPKLASELRQPIRHVLARVPAKGRAHRKPAAGRASRACRGSFMPGGAEITCSRSETRLRGFETGCRARVSVRRTLSRRGWPSWSARS